MRNAFDELASAYCDAERMTKMITLTDRRTSIEMPRYWWDCLVEFGRVRNFASLDDSINWIAEIHEAMIVYKKPLARTLTGAIRVVLMIHFRSPHLLDRIPRPLPLPRTTP